MEVFSIKRDVFSENKIEELEEKIDKLIENYKIIKEENEKLNVKLKSLEGNDKNIQEKIIEIKKEREILIDKVTKILEKVEKVEI
jgi:RecB family endonuclease NucS